MWHVLHARRICGVIHWLVLARKWKKVAQGVREEMGNTLDGPGQQVSGDGSVSVGSTDGSERWDNLPYDADGTDLHGRSIPNSSMGGSEVAAPSSSTGPCNTSTTKGSVVVGCVAPPPPPYVLFFCECSDEARASSTAGDERAVGMWTTASQLQDEGRDTNYCYDSASDDDNYDDDDGLVFEPRHSNRRDRHNELFAPRSDDSPDFLGGDEGSSRGGESGGGKEGRHWALFYACGFGSDGVDGGGAAGRVTPSARPRPSSIGSRGGGMQVFEADRPDEAGFVGTGRDLVLTRRTPTQKTDAELGGAERVIKRTIVLIKQEHAEAEAEPARGRYVIDNKLITLAGAAAHAVAFTATLSAMSIECFDDGARADFAVDVATALGVPRDGVRVTGARHRSVTGRSLVGHWWVTGRSPVDQWPVTGACAGSVIVETSVTVDGGAEVAAAVASSLTDPANPLVDEFRFGPCAVSGVRIEESAAATPAEAAPAEAPAEPAPPSAPAVTNNDGPLRSTVVVFHGDDDNGGLWDCGARDDDGELDEEEEAVRQDSGGASAAAAAAAGLLGLQLVQILCTGGPARQEESPVKDSSSTPAPDGASAIGRTFDDITKLPPPHLRCVVSPLSSLCHPSSGAPPRHCRILGGSLTPRGEAGSGRALLEASTRLFGALAV